MRRPISRARRVFPTPPGPTSVIRRARGSSSHFTSVSIGVATDNPGQRNRKRDAAQFLDRRAVWRGARHAQERIPRRPAEIERCHQRPQRLDVRTSPFSALERADGVNREARDRCELLLGKACCFAERLQMRPKRTPERVFIFSILLHRLRVLSAGWPVPLSSTGRPSVARRSCAPCGRSSKMNRHETWRSAFFGAQLKTLREAAGFTQSELATIAGLSVHAVSALERDSDGGLRSRPSVRCPRRSTYLVRPVMCSSRPRGHLPTTRRGMSRATRRCPWLSRLFSAAMLTFRRCVTGSVIRPHGSSASPVQEE